MQKTRVVAVERSVRHPRYRKYVTLTSKFKAHDEKNEYRAGDKVIIREVSPRSKDKRWVIVSKAQVDKSVSSQPRADEQTYSEVELTNIQTDSA